MKKLRVADIIYWTQIAHALAIYAWFLIIPNLQMVYFGTPYYWRDWTESRCAALGLYLIASGISAAISSIGRYG